MKEKTRKLSSQSNSIVLYDFKVLFLNINEQLWQKGHLHAFLNLRDNANDVRKSVRVIMTAVSEQPENRYWLPQFASNLFTLQCFLLQSVLCILMVEAHIFSKTEMTPAMAFVFVRLLSIMASFPLAVQGKKRKMMMIVLVHSSIHFFFPAALMPFTFSDFF